MSDHIAGKLRQDLLAAYLDADKFSAEDIAHLKSVHDPRVVDAFVAALADDALSPQEKAALRGDAAIKLASIHRKVGLNDRDLQDAVIAELRSIQGNHPESLSNLSIPGLSAELER